MARILEVQPVGPPAAVVAALGRVRRAAVGDGAAGRSLLLVHLADDGIGLFRHGTFLSGSGRSGTRAGAVGAQAPVDDLGLVDREAVVVGRGQARRLTDGAVDVDDRAAGAAHEVVVVVADARLVAGDGARRPRLCAMSRLRVATYNLYLGADLALLFGVADLDELAQRVEVVRSSSRRPGSRSARGRWRRCWPASGRDLVGLQEVVALDARRRAGTAGEQVLVDFLPALLTALEDAGCRVRRARGQPELRRRDAGLADGEWMGLAGANVTLVRRDGPVEVVGEATATFDARLRRRHRRSTASRSRSVRSWGRVDVRVDGRPLRFVNTHTEAYDARVRDAQRDEVLAAHGDVDGAGRARRRPQRHARTPSACRRPGRDAWTRGDGDGLHVRAGRRPRQPGEHAARADRLRLGPRRRACSAARVVGDRPGRPDHAARGCGPRTTPAWSPTSRSEPSSVRRAAPQRLGLAAPLLARQPALLRAAGRPGRPAPRAAGERWPR